MVGKLLIAQCVKGNLDQFCNTLVLDRSTGPSRFQNEDTTNNSGHH
jgi:hypothetical protein